MGFIITVIAIWTITEFINWYEFDEVWCPRTFQKEYYGYSTFTSWVLTVLLAAISPVAAVVKLCVWGYRLYQKILFYNASRS